MMLSAESWANELEAPLVEWYKNSPLPIVLIEAVAEPSLAERRALSKLGIATAKYEVIGDHDAADGPK